jgi:CRISPR/Cas system-associated exonuclease Cas4 (RecB family)
MMSRIKTKNDISFVIDDFIDSGIINAEQANSIHALVAQIVEHPKLKAYFNAEYTIYNEKDIISMGGNILRPDRLVINSENEVVIIDYKTGHEDNKHKLQLESYQSILEEMQYVVFKKILVYINDDIQIKEI